MKYTFGYLIQRFLNLIFDFLSSHKMNLPLVDDNTDQRQVRLLGGSFAFLFGFVSWQKKQMCHQMRWLMRLFLNLS